MLAFKSGGVVLDTSQVQVMVPPLCVLIHAVVLPLGGGRLGTLTSAAEINNKTKQRKTLGVLVGTQEA